ncbi:MAG: 3-phosphoshikimate 1-carboxyvinyltransferase [Candidatus Omnitrophica bacterium]|nr:3-phosphoshikimate 1-carboxyvinyltransferase [Candidatus Omnitrophota bacterium]
MRGTLSLPPDKAICHRAVLAAALGIGTTEIHPWPLADDCQRTLQLVADLGVPVKKSPQTVWIDGRGDAGLRAPTQELFCGESGTTLRLAAGLLAGQPFTTRLSAGPSLSRRPMRRIVDPLSEMGARLEGRQMASSDPSSRELYPPLTVRGRRPLRAVRCEMELPSAQVKSAILLAGLFADGATSVVERVPTRDHTERILRAFGAGIRREGRGVTIEPGALRSPGALVLPGDFSSAAFFVVAASCVPGSRLVLEGVGLNPTRLGLLEILKRMGGCLTTTVSEEGWEPRGTVVVEARSLRGVSVGPSEVPGVIDELPVLMVAAACATGTTRFHGVGELRVKETDRIRSMVNGLRQLGARIVLPAPDAVEIDGGPLRGAVAESAGDHRTAMSLAVAGLVAEGATTVRGVACVAKSFPEFFDHLRAVAGSPTVKTVDNP